MSYEITEPWPSAFKECLDLFTRLGFSTTDTIRVVEDQVLHSLTRQHNRSLGKNEDGTMPMEQPDKPLEDHRAHFEGVVGWVVSVLPPDGKIYLRTTGQTLHKLPAIVNYLTDQNPMVGREHVETAFIRMGLAGRLRPEAQERLKAA